MQPRVAAGVICGALAATLGALILGEYEFTGTMPLFAGVLFGLVVGEVVVSVSGMGGVLLAIFAAACSAGGLGWAGWLDSNRGVEPLHAGVWAAVMLGAVSAWGRVAGLPKLRGRR